MTAISDASQHTVRTPDHLLQDPTIRKIGWGTGSLFRNWRGRHIPLDYLVDNAASAWDTEVHGLEVKPPDALRSESPDRTLVVIYSQYAPEIAEQLSQIGPFPYTTIDMIDKSDRARTRMDQYAQMQRRAYDIGSAERRAAERMVVPDYESGRAHANALAAQMLAEFESRTHRSRGSSPLRVLDFGCGVGRMMEAFRGLGVAAIDGADISQEMLRHAAASPDLQGCRFFLTDGMNVGDVADGAYDLVYSTLCMHHICMRQTRIAITAAMARALKPQGMVWLQYKLYPGVRDDMIPRNHARWADNKLARTTNSAADVWVTPDSIGEVYRDMSLFFSDLRIQDESSGANYDDYTPDATYQYPFNEMYVSGTKTPLLAGSPARG